MSIGVQSCLSDSGSFIEDDNPEQLTIESLDAIKIMADVEEDVKKHFVVQVKELEEELRKKQEVIEQLTTKYVETLAWNNLNIDTNSWQADFEEKNEVVKFATESKNINNQEAIKSKVPRYIPKGKVSIIYLTSEFQASITICI